MDGSVKSSASLEVSVSFGRFESDGLSWEKWSSFSPNKYLEEAGTLSTPGSVAQKKAYFEAHYRKIAAKKAEESELEKSMGPVIPRVNMSSKENCVVNSSELDSKFGISNRGGLAEEGVWESCITLMPNGDIVHEAEGGDAGSPKGDEKGVRVNGSSDTTTLDAEKEDAVAAVTCEISAVEESKDVLNGNVQGAELDIRRDDPLVGSETLQKSSLEKPPGRKKGMEKSRVLKQENSKLNARITAEKVTPSRKDRSLAGTTRTVSPAVKRIQTSVPGHSKPSSTLTPTSVSKTFKKQVNQSQLPKPKNSVVGESKRAAPTSLHMSLSLGSPKSLSGISTTRKSLIMEKMGDKDIVKRAFKTFQNRTIESTSEEKATQINHRPSAAFETKISAPRMQAQGHERLKKDAEKRASQRSQLGTMSNPLSKGSHKSSASDRKIMAASTPTMGIRSNEKAEKRKEFMKKLEAKSIAREAANTQLIAKS